MSVTWRGLWLTAGALLMWTGVAGAQNLNQEHGPTWGCNAISLTDDLGRSLEGLYQTCRLCEAKGMDTFRNADGVTGRCVPRAGAGPGAKPSGDSGQGSAIPLSDDNPFAPKPSQLSDDNPFRPGGPKATPKSGDTARMSQTPYDDGTATFPKCLEVTVIENCAAEGRIDGPCFRFRNRCAHDVRFVFSYAGKPADWQSLPTASPGHPYTQVYIPATLGGRKVLFRGGCGDTDAPCIKALAAKTAKQ